MKKTKGSRVARARRFARVARARRFARVARARRFARGAPRRCCSGSRRRLSWRRALNARMGRKTLRKTSFPPPFHYTMHMVYASMQLLTRLCVTQLYYALCQAEQFYLVGADALIVTDLGLAQLLRCYFPRLAASRINTSGWSRDFRSQYLAAAGFTRMICAREPSLSNLRALCSGSPVEIEVFVHGALCFNFRAVPYELNDRRTQRK